MQSVHGQQKLRNAYTLLELMIALGLLGALMSVAWSLMSTFRDAEQRGWKITRRTQVIRAAHAWLQSDAQHVIASKPEITFNGNSLGFTTTIAPSLDPLPFLERLMSNSSEAEEFDSPEGRLSTTSRATSTLATSPGDNQGEMEEFISNHSPWNQQRLQIEYELLPVISSNNKLNPASAAGSASSAQDEEPQFMLVRSELFGGTDSSGTQTANLQVPNQSSQFGSSLNAAQSISASDRVLTGQDLYRQNEEGATSRGVPVAQSRLEGLVRPQFQYSDGRTWRNSWNSRSDGGLPAAIAFRFDFPARAQMQPPEPRRAYDEQALDTAYDGGDASEFSAADMALASESQVELETDSEASLMESDQFEVQMVIALAGPQGRPQGRPQGAAGEMPSSPALDAAFGSAASSPVGHAESGLGGLRGGF